MVTIRKNNHAIIAQDYSTYNGMRVGMLNDNAINKDFEVSPVLAKPAAPRYAGVPHGVPCPRRAWRVWR